MITSKTFIISCSKAPQKWSSGSAHFQKSALLRAFFWLFAISITGGGYASAQTFNYQGSAASIGSGCHAITPDLNNQRGAMWEQSTIDFTKDFEIKFSALFGAADIGADGIALVFQNSSATALGGNGAALGFGTNLGNVAIPQSLAIEFDTYNNGSSWGDGGSGSDHIALVANGAQATPLRPIVDAHVSGQNIEDNEYHHIVASWNATNQTLRVYFDGMLRTSITQNFVSTVFGSNPHVYWGITGATGSNTNSQVVCHPEACIGSPEFQASIGHLVSGVPDDGEEAFSVKPANDCGYIAVGQTSLPPTTFGEMMAVKTDNDGNTEWVHTYSFGFGTSIDKGVLTNVEALGDGYIATGWTRFDVRSLIILRLENDGSVRWARVQAGSHIWEEGYDIEPTPDGGFAVVGYTQDRVFMIHLDQNGVQNWSRSYGRENEIWKAYSVASTDDDGDGVQDDGFVIAGTRSTSWDPTTDWVVIKTDHLGNLQSAESIGVFGVNDQAFSVKQVDINSDGVLDANQYVVGGYVSLGASSRQIAAFAHYSASGLNGNPVSAVILDDGINASRINALEQNVNGDIVCTGYLEEATGVNTLRDGFFVHSTLDGSYSWSQVLGTTGNDDWFNSVEELNGLGYVLAGGTESFSNNDGDFYIAKIDEWGSSPCNTLNRAYAAAPVEMYSYIESPTQSNFADLSTRQVYLSVEVPDEDNCMVINKKASHTTSMDNPEESTVAIYPNPVANGSILHIGIEEGLTGNAQVVLTDITGKTQLVKQYSLTQGSSELSLPINQLSPGMYHVSVRTHQGTSVYKVLIE